MAYNILKHRRGTTQEWLDVDLIPEDGELVIEECANGYRRCKLGDGYTKFSLLPYIDEETQLELLSEIAKIDSTFTAELERTKINFSSQISDTVSLLEKDIIEHTENLTKDYISRDTKLASKLDKSLSSGLAKVEEGFQSTLIDVEARVNSTVESVKTSLEESISGVANELYTKIDASTEAISSNELALRSVETRLTDNLRIEISNRESQALTTAQRFKVLDEILEQEIQPAVKALDAKIVETTGSMLSQHNKDFEQLHTDLENSNTLLNQRISELEGSLETTIQPAVVAINKKIAETATEITDQHAKDIAQLQVDLKNTDEVINSKLSDLEASLEEHIQPSIEAVDKKFTTRLDQATNQHKLDIDQLHTDLTDVNVSLETQLTALEETVDNLVLPTGGFIDKKLSEATETILNIHNEDITHLHQSIDGVKSFLSSEIIKQTEDFNTSLTQVSTELNSNIDNKIEQISQTTQVNLKSLDLKHAEGLDEAKNAFEAKISETDSVFQDRLNEVKNSLVEADQTLSNIISQIEQQSKQATDSINLQLTVLAEQLENADISLLNKFYSISNNINNLTAELSQEITNLKQKQNTESAYLGTELQTLSKVQNTSQLNIANLLFEHVTRFYAELADLVDDDIIILNKVFNIENDLSFAIKELDDRLTDSLDSSSGLLDAELTNLAQTLSTRIEEINQTLTESISSTKQTLTENVETLRSTSNLQINSTLKAIDNLEIRLHEEQQSILDKYASTESTVNQLNARLEGILTEVNTKFVTTNTRIDTVSSDLDTQTKRVSNLLAALTRSETADASELIDIRNGYNGLYYECAGDAVRAVGNDLEALKKSLPDYIPANAVDGLLYENNQLFLTSGGEPVSDPVTITGGGGGGGSFSVVKITNNLASSTFTLAKGSIIELDFTYTSFENEVPTGDGTCTIIINNKTIESLSCTVLHNVAKKLNITDYLKTGTNSVKVVCTDSWGASRSLIYNISVIELKIESSFNDSRIFDGDITFRYKITGQVEKTVHVLLDGKEILNKTFSASVSGNESTLTIIKQPHGCHKLTAFITAHINDEDVQSNILTYEILCVEEAEDEAMLSSVYETKAVTQGDLVTIPFMLYDPVSINNSVDLIIYSAAAGQLTELSRTALTVDRAKTFWNTRQYPAGQVVFTISYTYSLYGVTKTITKAHTVTVQPLELDISAETDSLQLYLTAQGRTNNEKNPAIWEFKPDDSSNATVTTTFTHFNWKTNGWITDENGDACLRLTGDARAEINFKPFATDFKENGKTIEFEFVVRDVNSREAVVIDCFDGERGFRATPDTAFLQSSGTKVSCRYKDNERIRIAVSVEYADSLSKFVSIYLDGILSGVQRYVADTDNFAQDKPLNIKLGSSLCGLDVYSIRIYDKALTTSQILTNYIADLTEPTSKLALMSANDILENDKVSYDRVRALGQVPIITFTGQMPTYKGDKKKKSVRMKFEDPAHPELNFDVLLDQIDVQGTSSQYYVRKNWKVKLPEARSHMPNAISAKVFCIKVDYAEATGTHNTGTANYVETFYDRTEVTLPPQKDDTRIRTTVQGFPCVIFEKATEDSEPIFSSKGNFNYDKDAENAFGFVEAYNNFGVECWEVCNNTSPSCNFLGEIIADWSSDFEPRYVPESANFERIEELLELRELAAKGLGIFTDAQATELAQLQADCVNNFKIMHDWVLSTATHEPVLDEEGKVIGIRPITEKPLASAVTYGDTTYTIDNAEYRLAKFKYEFEDYFNLHYCSIYYVFTFFALMTDQRAKNMFLTRWKDDDGKHRWYPYFYDNDTIFGINNEGALVFDYFHEDTDQLGSSNVYNGQNSTLWNNFRQCFPKKIADTYAELRSSNILTYDAIVNRYITEGSDKWSAAIYNADAEYKYVSMAREIQTEGKYEGSVDDSNLYQVRGPGEHHLRYFASNRINYCDSKWYAGKYPDDYIFLRIYTPTLAQITDDMSDEKKAEIQASNERISRSLEAVPANPNITVTTFSDMYAGVKYKANGLMQQQRLSRGKSHTFTPPTPETFNDTETGIYGASELSSLGDLSGLYCGVISLGKASKLTDITIGNSNPNYRNDNFREIRVGSNRLLRSIDLRNCSGLGLASGVSLDSGWDSSTAGAVQTTLDLTGCPNIETIYTEGTNLQTVALPESGYVKTLHLPASIRVLVIKNQLHISDFSVASYANIRTLRLENCPTLDTDGILAACKNAEGKYTVERVHLTGINWNFSDATFVKSLFPQFDNEGTLISGIRGIGTNNENLDDAYLVGTCYIEKLTGTEYTEIKSHYPYLDIKFGEMTSNVTFKYADITGKEHEHSVSITCRNSVLGECFEPILNPTPAWPENEAFTYERVGWSRKKQVSKGIEDTETDYLDFVHQDALQNIAGDRTVYPVFKAVRKSYPVHFINLTDSSVNKLLQTVETPYGSNAVYTGNTPIKLDAASPSLYTFTGWNPKPENITGETSCYAQFAILNDQWYTLGINDISNCQDQNGNIFDGYTLNDTKHTMAITKCNNTFNAAVRIPDSFSFDKGVYQVITVGGFSNYKNLELVDIPDVVEEISASGFYNCYGLFEIILPKNLKTIGLSAFQNCAKLKTIYIPATVTSIGEAALADCKNLESIIVDEANTRYIVVNDCLIDTKNSKLLQGLSTGSIPLDGSIKTLGTYCFSNTNITSTWVPEGVLAVANNAFSRCYELRSVRLPSTLQALNATCFAWCYNLVDVNLPEGLRYIYTYAFDSCALTNIVIPSTVERVLERSFGDMATLETVTFKKSLDKSGTIKVPEIDEAAFANSGSTTHKLVFNLPWSADKTPDAPWGAKNCILNFDYVEEAE